MKLVATKDAVGHVLCHDITQIIKDVSKGRRFKKGHIVQEEDIPVLLSLGKDHLYIYENDESMMHENEAAEVLAKLTKNAYMNQSEVKEGKIELTATTDGLLLVDKQRLFEVNSFGQMMIATRHHHTPIKKGDVLAGMRIIPLVIEKEKMENIQAKVGTKPILEIKPYHPKKVALLVTGNEVYYKRISDTFTPVLKEKLKEFPTEIIHEEILPDNDALLTQRILEMKAKGADIILCTGGMSVDPDDKTPLAIKNTKANIISYGAPVLPGAMFLLAYLDNTTIMGLPGCVMYARRTIFDLVLPSVMADEKMDKDTLARLGSGGLCLNCEVCTYPNCGFGKGW